MCQIGAFHELTRKIGIHQNKHHPGNAPDTRRQCVKVTDQWAQGVANRSNSLVDWPHFAASRGLASRAHSPRGGNKESGPGSQWKSDLVVARPTPVTLPT
jgi:hypothetical protein